MHKANFARILALALVLVMTASCLSVAAFADDAAPAMVQAPVKVQVGIVINGNLQTIYVEPGVTFDLPTVAAPEGKEFAGWQMDAVFVNDETNSSVLPTSQTSVNISSMLKAVLFQPTFKDAPVDPVEPEDPEDPNAGKVQVGIVIDGNLQTDYLKPGITFSLPAVTAPEGKEFAGWQMDAVFVNGEKDSTVLPVSQTSVDISSMLKAILLQPTFKDAPVDPVEPEDPNAGKVQVGIVIDGKLQSTYVEPGCVFELPAVTAPEGKEFAGWQMDVSFVNGETDSTVLPAGEKEVKISEMLKGVLFQPTFRDAPVDPVEPEDPNAGKVQFGIIIDGNLQTTYVEPGYVFDLTTVAAPEGKVLTGWSIQAKFIDGTVDESTLPADTESLLISKLTAAVLIQPIYEDAPVDPNAGKVQFGIVIDGDLHTTYVEPGYVFDLTSVDTPEGKVLTGWKLQAMFLDGSVDESTLPADTESLLISKLTAAVLIQPIYEDAPVDPVDPNAGKVQFGIVIDGDLQTTYVEPGYVFDLTSVATPEGKVLTGWNLQAMFPDGSVDASVLAADTESLLISRLTVAVLVQPIYEDAPVDPVDPTDPEEKPTDPEEKPTEPEGKPTDPVVKPSTPSNNGEKIIPKTGVSTSVSAALVVVCIIAGFTTYMIVLRKKQDVSAR